MELENTSIPQSNGEVSQPISPQTTSDTSFSCKLSGFGYFFSKTFSVYKNNFWTFLFLSLVPSIIVFVLSMVIELTTLNPFLIYPVIIIVTLWFSLSLLYAVKEREIKLTIGSALKKGWSRLGSGIFLSFLSFVIIFAGFVLFIIPGIIFSIGFLLSMYVLVNEEKGAIDSLKKSKELISGYVIAFWGRTILFVFTLYIFLLLLTVFGYFFSPINYAINILSFFLGSFSTIFNFLLYEQVKRAKETGCSKSPMEIKYILLPLLLLSIIIGGMVASVALVSMGGARDKAKDVRVKADMMQIRTVAEFISMETADAKNVYGDDYSDVNCNNPKLSDICNDVREASGNDLIIRSKESSYCSYIETSEGYYCIDSSGFEIITTSINPGSIWYCDGLTFICPK